eukprot:15334648-Ditylum_brightwellii.AAC.1
MQQLPGALPWRGSEGFTSSTFPNSSLHGRVTSTGRSSWPVTDCLDQPTRSPPGHSKWTIGLQLLWGISDIF